MRYKLKNIRYIIFCLFLIGNFSNLFCQSDEYFFSHYSSGLGARALGMGKAYLAVSDDSTASSWNPAGLAALSRPRFSISLSYFDSRDKISDYTYTTILYGFPVLYEVFDINSESSGQYLDFLSVAYPFRIFGKNVVTQLSYQRKIPFSFTQKYEYKFEFQSSYRYDYDYYLNAVSSGGFDVISITLATEIFKNLRLGVTFDRWFNGYSLPVEELHAYSVENFYGLTDDWDESTKDTLQFDISGYGLSVGLLYRISNSVNLGLVYKTSFQGNLDYSNDVEFYNSYDGTSLSGYFSGTGEIYLPAAFGAGIAMNVTQNMMITFDYMRTLWSKGKIKDYARGNSDGDVPSLEDFLYPTMKPPGLYEQLDTQHFAGGMEYWARIKKIKFPLRAGLFYDFQYSLDSENLQKRYLGISFGSGFRWKNLNLDVAVVHYSSKFKYLQDYFEVYFDTIGWAKTKMIVIHATLNYRF